MNNNTKRLIVLGMLLLLAVFLVGCGGSPVSQLPKYTLHIKIDPEGAGSVEVTDGSKFSKDAEVILTPKANQGWAFDHWAGFNANQVIAQGNAWKIIMDSDKSLTAVFKQLPTNQSPTVSLAAEPLSGPAPLAVKFTATGHDPDNDPLKYDWTFGDGATQANGGATPTHTYQNPGSYVAKVTVKDEKGGTASAEVTIQVAQGNHNPTVVNDTATLDEDTEINIDVLANDTDADSDTLTISAVSEATNGTVAIQNGLIHYVPKANYNGSDSFTYTAADGKGGQATATVTVTVSPVNDAPVAVNDTAKVEQDNSVLIDVLQNDTDVDGDTLSIASFGLANSGTVTTEGNSLRYTPKAGYYGEDQFNYVVNDGKGGSAQATVTVTVNRVNHVPVAVNDSADVDEDSNVLIQVLANDTDADNDTLTVQSITQGAHGAVVKEGNSLRYTPAANYNGSDSFTYTVNDGFAGTASATVTVTVKPVNDAPVALNDAAQVDEDDSVLISVLANDDDVDGDTLTVQNILTQGAHGAVTKEGNDLRYTPVANYNGSDSFTYEVSDGKGGKATATVTVNVKAVNDLPVAGNDTASLDEDGNVLVKVLANDTDVDNDTLTIQSFTQGIHGTVTKEGNDLRYTPAANYNGSDSFTYVVSDGNGGTASATVTLTINAVNDAPIAKDDIAQFVEGETVLVNVLQNDSDVDGDTLSLIDFTQGTKGTVTKEGNSLRYTPTGTNFSGQDQFSYTISDGKGGTDTATVTITVDEVNDPPTATPDVAVVNEDSTIVITVLDNDSDIEGDTLTITEFTQGGHGTVVKEGNALRYTPDANYNGPDTFTYTISDGNGGTASTTVSITVQAVNDTPAAINDTAQVDEDGNVLVDVLTNDTDVDGDILTVSDFAQGAHGTVVKVGNSLRYTPAANFYGSDSFTYQISDGKGGTATATVNVTIKSVNDTPVATNDTATVDEDANVLVNVLANDTDVEGDALTITSCTQGTHGTVAQEGNSLRYTPVANYNGTDSFTYQVSDGNGGVSTATVNVTVTAVNDNPVAVNDAAPVDEDGNVLVDVVANDTDVDGDTLTVTSFVQGTHGTVAKEGNSLRYTPTANYNGSDSFTYQISDGNSGTATATVNVTVNAVNDAPIANNDTATVNEDANVLVDVLANDSDVEGDALTITGFAQGSHGAVAKEGNSLRYTPAANYNGADSFTYQVSDGQGGVTTATVNVTVTAVNDNPVAVNDAAAVDEDGNVLVDVVTNDTDVDGDSLTVASFAQGTHGTVAKEGNSLRYTPAHDYNGSDSFTYQINDGNGGSATATVNMTVNSVNDAPIANNDTATVNEDANVLVNVLVNDSDVEGDSLTINSFTQGSHGTVAKEGNSLRYTPAANYNGTDSFTYQVSDGKGGVTTATVNVTVTPVNDAPVAVNDAADVDQNSNVLIDVLANDNDLDGDALTVTSFTQGAHGTVVKEGNSLRYTPALNYTGSDSFTYQISDGKGETATATVNLTVKLVNVTPIANNDAVTVSEDANVLVNVLGNDTDADGDTLSVNSFTQGAHGTVAKEDNSLRYTPAANYHGADSFTYEISDGKGGVATATVNVTVESVNDTPVAVNDATTLDEDGTILIDVVANDSDVDGDSLTVASFGQGTHGTVAKEGNSLRYTPAENYNGSDSFTYQISDGNGGTATATVNVTVNSVNDAPVANNDVATVNEDDTVLINVLGNDSDVEGEVLSINSYTQGTHGTVAQEGNSLRYTPAANYHGADSFTYQVSDGNGGVTTATVNVTVDSVNDSPVAVDDTTTLDEDGTILIDVVANDSDVEGDTLTISSMTQGAHGTVVQVGNSLRYTPTADFYGSDSFTYQISDGNGGTATATVNVTVNSVNDAPVANTDTVTVNEDDTTLINILGNDSDVDGDSMNITTFTQGSHGTVAQEGNSLRYTPVANYHGADSFTYTISDGKGGETIGTVNVTVDSVNDAPVANNDSATLDEDGTTLIDVVANDSDLEGDTLTVTILIQGAHGTVVKEGNSLRYTPTANYYGSDSFTYQISDGNGGTATATVNLTVNSVNDAPIANNDAATLNEDDNVLINVLANDSEVEGEALSMVSFTQATHGTVTQEGNSLRYTPEANYNGADSFIYTISDEHGSTTSATVSVTVQPVNDTPVAVNDNTLVNEDANVLVDVIANDSDLDGDILTVSNFTHGAHGTVVKAGNSLRYTPAANYYGVDSFTYEVNDGHGGTATATVNVTVNSVNDAPVANADTAEVNQDETILIDVLPNDSDIDGDALSISSVTQGSHGMVSKEGNSIRYTPDAGYNGPDSFTYTISDGHGGIATTLVNVTVKPTGPIVLVSMDFEGPSYMTGKIPFTVTQAGNYQLQTSYHVGECDTVLYLFDASETMIANNDDYTDLYSCIIMWLEPGDYYVSVEEISTNPLFCHLQVSSI